MLLENESYPDDSRVRLEAESLTSAGYAVTVICPTGDFKGLGDSVNGVTVRRYPKPPNWPGVFGYAVEFGYSLVMQTLWAVWLGATRGFDAVHMHTPPDLNAFLPVAFRMLGKKYVCDLHDLSPELFRAQRAGAGGGVLLRLLRGFERLAVRNADRLITTNDSQRRLLAERHPLRPEHCVVVRNGPDQSFLGPVEPLPEIADPGRTIIGYVGMIGVQDGVDHFVRALAELRKTRPGAFRGVIVGGGPALADLERLAGDLGLADELLFTGLIPPGDVPGHIAAFDICVTPDPSNPYNDSCTTIKTMEYMALGKPTVCYQTPENRLTAGDSALYASDNDPLDFADKIQQLMDDPDRRLEMGARARRRLLEGLTWRSQSGNLVAMYDRLFNIERNDPAADHHCEVRSAGLVG